VTSSPPVTLPPVAKAGYLVHRGIQGSDPTHVRNVLSVLPPAAKPGVDLSKKEMGTEWIKVMGSAAVGGFAGFEIAGPVGALVGTVAGGLIGTKL
jgi:hypothetical protein